MRYETDLPYFLSLEPSNCLIAYSKAMKSQKAQRAANFDRSKKLHGVVSSYKETGLGVAASSAKGTYNPPQDFHILATFYV